MHWAGLKLARPSRWAASRYVARLPPTSTSRRPDASAAAFSASSRCTLDAKQVATTRPLVQRATRSARFPATVDSEMVRPGASTLVESDISSVTPSLPTRSKAARSNCSLSIGCSSIFQSPVCTIVPSSHRKNRPQQSGMECVTRTASTENGPARNVFSGPTVYSLNRAGSHSPNSVIRFLISAIVNDDAYTGVDGSSAGRIQGSAPMWSSWPCVMITASTLSLYLCRNEVSGSTFCWPSSSKPSGNMRPASSMT